MTTAKADDKRPDDLAQQAAQNTLAANPIIGIQGGDITSAVQMLARQAVSQPGLLAKHWLTLAADMVQIASGTSKLAADPKDKRFQDPAWQENPLFSRVLQSYVAWGNALMAYVDEADMTPRDAGRARFVLTLAIDAMAPSNGLLTNPAALKKAAETNGASLKQGLEHFVHDITKNGGLPTTVDKSAFEFGKNIATSPGAVVFRNELIELVQYAPTTPTVYQRPLIISPPQINKFYAVDLSPQKSLAKYILDSGVRLFIVSWRNPTAAHKHWGLSEYVAALDGAVDAAREITGSPDVSMWGSCSGGITLASYLGHLAARGDRKVRNAVLAVCVLDTTIDEESPAGLFVTPESLKAAKAGSSMIGVVEGREMERMFAWMRPNDLIWNYWVSNYLLGNAPPAFDILFWNADTTRLPAKLHGDYLDLVDTNPFVNGGRLTVCGTPIDMREVDVKTYVIGGTTDHITPWQGVYQTARLMGDKSTFVLSNSGHLQSLLNPPGNPKSFFLAKSATETDGEAWAQTAERHGGSWWPHWRGWIQERSGPERAAPKKLGSKKNPEICPSPGTYVMEP
jgi:polyhydroxyalkanoate synthase subunit PhaC